MRRNLVLSLVIIIVVAVGWLSASRSRPATSPSSASTCRVARPSRCSPKGTVDSGSARPGDRDHPQPRRRARRRRARDHPPGQRHRRRPARREGPGPRPRARGPDRRAALPAGAARTCRPMRPDDHVARRDHHGCRSDRQHRTPAATAAGATTTVAGAGTTAAVVGQRRRAPSTTARPAPARRDGATPARSRRRPPTRTTRPRTSCSRRTDRGQHRRRSYQLGPAALTGAGVQTRRSPASTRDR